MFNVVLVHPEIPPNTGNVIRLCANTGCHLHLIEPLGFSLDDKQLRRAGLDYHEYASVQTHASWAAFVALVQPLPERCFAFTTRGSHNAFDTRFQAGDWLVFGSETQGLPSDLRDSFPLAQRLLLVAGGWNVASRPGGQRDLWSVRWPGTSSSSARATRYWTPSGRAWSLAGCALRWLPASAVPLNMLVNGRLT